MKYLTYSKQSAYPVCFLVPKIFKDEIQKEYLTPFGIEPEDVMVINLHYNPETKKTSVSEMKQFVSEELVPTFTDMGVQYVLVADPEYFKLLTKASKAEPKLGYVLDCVFGPWKVAYVPNFRQVFYDPARVRSKIAQAVQAVIDHASGSYQEPGTDIIHFAAYPKTVGEIEGWLQKLLDDDRPLACDIETFSLKHHSAGIGSITFCWSKHEGIAFPVDLGANGKEVRALLKDFFMRFNNRLVFHKIDFDAYILIYQLFMKDILDTEGLLNGMEIMLKNWDCTRLITYLATNTCAGNRLSLKDQAQEFAGNYALLSEDPDITKIPLDDLLQYNLVDGLSTWYVYEKHWDTLVSDQQLEVYENIFKPAILDIIQMQLTGMPLDMEEVKRTKEKLTDIYEKARASILGSRIVQAYGYRRMEHWVAERNATWKKKRTTVTETLEAIKTNDKLRDELTFNPNSGPQLQDLLYNVLGLPVIALTDSRQPAVDGDTLKALRNHTTNPDVLAFLDAQIDYGAVNKILTAFIPAMENAVQGPDGWHYLFGCFNLAGTISGRLSSSDPNLQNLPANSLYAKLIKKCFAAPPGWVFVGLDFDSLEDRISALTTRDPAKLKVYLDGYDGHSLRAYTYFDDQMPDIDPNSVESINSVAKKYKPLRQDSKAPTFALTYQGTWKTLMKNCGFSEEKAKRIEERYHQLYRVSDEWVARKLDEASRTGYVTIAFGLRLRTPKLAQVIRGNSKTPHEAEAEGRSAGNALGQSWCLLNSRAWSETMGKVRKSPYRTMIRPCAQIHDAGYALVKDDIHALLYLNEHLVKAVQWQEHPDIQHDQVKLGGQLSIFYPNWNEEIGIPNGATEPEIWSIIDNQLSKAA